MSFIWSHFKRCYKSLSSFDRRKNKNSQYRQLTILNHRYPHFVPVYYTCFLRPLYTQRS